MTQPTLLSLENASHLKMPKKQAGGGGEFRSMLERNSARLEMPKPKDGGSDAALNRAAIRAEILLEVAGPGRSDKTNMEKLDDLPADDASKEAEPDDESAGAVPAADTTPISELRFLLGDAGSNGSASTEVEADAALPTPAASEKASTATMTKAVDPVRIDARTADQPALTSQAAAGDETAPAQTPGKATAEAVDRTTVRTAGEIAVPAAPESGKGITKNGPEGAAADGAKPAGDRIAPAVAGKGSSEARQDDAGQRDGRNEGKQALPGATVVAESPANAQSGHLPATRAVVVTLGADPAWAAYFRSKPAPSQAAPQSLTVQLRPAELGMVSAHLSFAGDRLTVELRPETQEAHRQLAADSEAITRSLRAIGLEVDQVTVQPASSPQDGGRAALNARADSQGGQGQGTAFASPDNQGDRGGGRQPGSGNSSGFGGRSGNDEIRGGAGGGDRDGRYI